jgi:hypothetical protein
MATGHKPARLVAGRRAVLNVDAYVAQMKEGDEGLPFLMTTTGRTYRL